MRRSILFLTLGILCTAIVTAAISVYIVQDVDHDQIGHWNEAFAGLCAEIFPFSAIIGVAVGFFAWLGRRLFHLSGHSPRPELGLFLGIGVVVLQYPWDFAGRKLVPEYAEFSLALYMVVSIVICTVVLLRDNFRQMKLGKAGDASPLD